MDANRINKRIIKMTLLLKNSLGTHRKNQSIANNAVSKVSDIPANWMATVNKLIEIYVIENKKTNDTITNGLAHGLYWD